MQEELEVELELGRGIRSPQVVKETFLARIEAARLSPSIALDLSERC